MFFKSVATMIFTVLSLSTSASAMEDGCYALYQPQSPNGALCIAGSSEEGIAGSGIRVMFVDTVGQPRWCGSTTLTKIRWSESGSHVAKYYFSSKSPIKSILMTWKKYGAKAEGKVRFNEGRKTDLFYLPLSAQTIKKINVREKFQSKLCERGLSLQ
ncbi:hypothetical protein N9D31_04190 [Oligoflexaceae bacterium]|nr:hypothetical protein [Oligoflexaceae bacterium]